MPRTSKSRGKTPFSMRSSNKTSFKEMGSSPVKFGMPVDPREAGYSDTFKTATKSGQYQWSQRNPWMADYTKRKEGESRGDHYKRFQAQQDRISSLSDEDMGKLRKLHGSETMFGRGYGSDAIREARHKGQADFWTGIDKRNAATAKAAEDAEYAKFAERFKAENAPTQPAPPKPLTGVDKLKANRPDFMKPRPPGEIHDPMTGIPMPQPASQRPMGGGGGKGSQGGKGGQRPTPSAPGLNRPMPGGGDVMATTQPRPQRPMNYGGGKGSQGGKGGQRPSPRPNPYAGMQAGSNANVIKTGTMLDPTVAATAMTKKAPYKMKRGSRPSFKDLGS